MTYRIPAISKLDDAGDSKTEKVTPGEMESQLSEKAAIEFFKMSDYNQPKTESNCLLASVHFLPKPPRTWSYIVAFACCIE